MTRVRFRSVIKVRSVRTWTRRVLASIALASVGLACDPVRSIGVSSASINTCPSYPCTKYVQANEVVCLAGSCVIQPATAPATHDLVVLVSMPQDAFYAADHTFVTTLDAMEGRVALVSTSASASATPLAAVDAAAVAIDAAGVTSVRSFRLPQIVTMSGDYEVTPQVAESVNRSLDQTRGDNAALPFHATFRLLWPQGVNGLVEATQLGLPVDPIQASVTTSPLAIGPGMGPLTEFAVSLPAQDYVRELVPDPPFDQAFGPVIQAIAASQPPPFQTVVRGYDITGGTTLPSLSISRADGLLDGWTAFLRDITTQRLVSNVAPLSGSSTSVTFAVKRSLSLDPTTPDLDALQNDVLVVAPPDGAMEPTGAFNLFNTLANVQYPALPPFVRVTGSVSTVEGTPVAASVTFEKESIVVRTSPASGAASPTALNTTNLELTRTVSASQSGMGASRYEAILPEGIYRIDVRPTDTTRAIQIESSIAITANSTLDFALSRPARVRGVAQVIDGRPLAGATVDAIPTQCASNSTTTWCLPRYQQAVTGPDGSFDFDVCPLAKTSGCVDAALDPGSYTLRVRPAAGTRLPWIIVAEPLTVSSGVSVSVPQKIIVPAPLTIGSTILDPIGNPAPHALVRVFRMGSRAGASVAVEVGQAVTEADGSYEMYVAPSSP